MTNNFEELKSPLTVVDIIKVKSKNNHFFEFIQDIADEGDYPTGTYYKCNMSAYKAIVEGDLEAIKKLTLQDINDVGLAYTDLTRGYNWGTLVEKDREVEYSKWHKYSMLDIALITENQEIANYLLSKPYLRKYFALTMDKWYCTEATKNLLQPIIQEIGKAAYNQLEDLQGQLFPYFGIEHGKMFNPISPKLLAGYELAYSFQKEGGSSPETPYYNSEGIMLKLAELRKLTELELKCQEKDKLLPEAKFLCNLRPDLARSGKLLKDLSDTYIPGSDKQVTAITYMMCKSPIVAKLINNQVFGDIPCAINKMISEKSFTEEQIVDKLIFNTLYSWQQKVCIEAQESYSKLIESSELQEIVHNYEKNQEAKYQPENPEYRLVDPVYWIDYAKDEAVTLPISSHNIVMGSHRPVDQSIE